MIFTIFISLAGNSSGPGALPLLESLILRSTSDFRICRLLSPLSSPGAISLISSLLSVNKYFMYAYHVNLMSSFDNWSSPFALSVSWVDFPCRVSSSFLLFRSFHPLFFSSLNYVVYSFIHLIIFLFICMYLLCYTNILNIWHGIVIIKLLVFICIPESINSITQLKKHYSTYGRTHNTVFTFAFKITDFKTRSENRPYCWRHLTCENLWK